MIFAWGLWPTSFLSRLFDVICGYESSQSAHARPNRIYVRYLLRTVPTNKEVFLRGYDYAGKADLSMGYWNPERKLGVAGHFLEIIKQQLF